MFALAGLPSPAERRADVAVRRERHPPEPRTIRGYSQSDRRLCVLERFPVQSQLADNRSERAHFEVLGPPIWQRGDTVSGRVVPLAMGTGTAAAKLLTAKRPQFAGGLPVFHGTTTTVSIQIGASLQAGRSTGGRGRFKS